MKSTNNKEIEEYAEKKEYIEINYMYPLINEIFDEIYNDIVLTKNINSIIFNIFEGGAKGELFEKIVIKNFTPSELNNYNVNFFGEFIVSKTYVVDKYVPKKNEKMEIENKNIYVENIPFLLKQKIFGGKAFDIVIVRFFGNKAIIYCFQITGHKKKEDLMKYDELEKNIKTMIKYLKNYFSFEIVSVYFSYIFNYANHYEKKIIKMCEDLDTRNIRYIFYDIYSEIYYDKYFNEVSEIGKTMSEFNFNSDEKILNGEDKRFLWKSEKEKDVNEVVTRKLKNVNKYLTDVDLTVLTDYERRKLNELLREVQDTLEALIYVR